MRLQGRHLVTLFGGLLVACGGTQTQNDPDTQKPEQTGTAQSETRGVGPIDPSHGFPAYYEDANLVRLQPCIDGAGDPKCILGGIPPIPGVYDKTLPTVFTSNFPDEFFYAYAAASPVATPGCPVGGGVPPIATAIPPGKALSVTGMEGSFANGVPVAGDQITFGRVRIVASGLCPGVPYDFTHPYGTETVIPNALGQVTANIKGFTEDIGCKGTPCNFKLAFNNANADGTFGSRVFNGFPRWTAPVPGDPDITGYVGDGATPHTITGTTNNVFTVRLNVGGPKGSGPIVFDATGTIPATTALFTVGGKLAGDLNAPAQGFGGQAVGTLSAPRTITVRNWSASSMTITGLAIGGTDAADFAVTGGTCVPGLVLAREASSEDPPPALPTSCTIIGTFTPGALGARSASLAVNATRNDGLAALPLSVPLSGTGIVAGGAPSISFDTAAVSFGNVHVPATSDMLSVTVTNAATATAPLEITNVTNVGPNAATFAIVQDTCTGKFLDPGMTCFVGVRATPATPTLLTSSLIFADTDPTSPQTIPMTVTGTGGLSGRSASTATYGFPDWYQDDNGIQVLPCVDQLGAPGAMTVDPLCLINPLPESDTNGVNYWDPTNPIVFPGTPAAPVNFPSEAFYYAATATLTLPGCPAAGITSGKSVGLLGVEATFASGNPIIGTDQITFGRKRFFTRGLCPNTTYRFTTPIGSELITADENGDVRANTKVDTGCLVAPCTFNEALKDPSFASFLRWDPTVAPSPPPGYLGDGVTPHSIVGGFYTAPGSSTPVDYYEIAQLDGTVVATTNQWVISGKAGQVRGAPQPITFTPEPAGVASAPQVVTITNVDPTTAITINPAAGSVFVGGNNPADFQIVPGTDTCTGAILAPCAAPFTPGVPGSPACPGTCTVSVQFQPVGGPGGLGNREAALIANQIGGLSSPMTVLMTGIAGTPNLLATPAGVIFDDQQQGAVSYPHDVQIRNTGTAPLIFGAGAVTLGGVVGDDPTQFGITGENCSGNSIPANGTCDINVTFNPNVIGTLTAKLNIVSNDAASPTSLPLSGLSITPAVGIAQPAPAAMAYPSALRGESTTLKADGTPAVVVVSNVGGAPLSISSLAVVGQHAGDFSLVADTCSGSPAIPVGGSCTFTARFAPTAAGVRNGIVNIYDLTGTNTLAVVPITGLGLVPSVAPIGLTTFAAAGAAPAFPVSTSSVITVTNSGTGNLVIPAAGGFTITGTGATQYAVTANTCTAAAIQPSCATPGVDPLKCTAVVGGNRCTVTVTFAPTTDGVKTATLNILSADALVSGTAALSGTGNFPILGFQGQAFSGNVKRGTTKTQGFNIVNTGHANLVIGNAGAGLRFPVGSIFQVVAGTSNKCNGATLAPGKSCSYNATFSPTAVTPLGTNTAVLSANSNDPSAAGGINTVTFGGTVVP